jgi:hypothetical protein
MSIKMGDEVKCMVTGFKGIVTSITEYLNGCRRMGVQPPVNKDGTMPDAFSLDEPQLVLVKAGKVKVGPQDTGGPMTRLTSSKITRR